MLALVLATSAVLAWAFWTAPGTGVATAVSGSLDAPTIGANAASFNSVTVNWTVQASLQGTPLENSAITYTVQRKLASGPWVAVSAGGCSGVKPRGVTSCVDALPATGSYSYRAIATFRTWTATSNEAGPVSVTVDSAAPANAITLSGVTGGAIKSGLTVYYRGAEAGSFTLTNAVSDSGAAGAAYSATAALSGTSTGWTHSPSLVTAPAGGPYVSSAFSWNALSTSSPGETVTGADAADNTTTTGLTFTNDSTAPTGGSVDATGLAGTGGRYSTSTSLSLALTKGTDATGLASSGAKLRRSAGTLSSGGSANGSCAGFSASVLVADDPGPTVADTVPAGAACYRYEYVVADGVGNSATYTSPDIKIDTSAPAAPALTFSAPTNAYWGSSSSTLYYRAAASSGAFTVTAATTDTDSGIDDYTFPTLPAAWSASPGAAGVRTYSWSAASPTAPSGAQNVTAKNNAASSSPATAFTMVSDVTTPATGNVTYTDRYYSSLSVAVTFDRGTDVGGSGVDATSGVLERTETALTSTGSCGTFDTPTTVGGTNPSSPFADTGVVSGKCYQYLYKASDKVANQATYTSANVAKVDAVAPTIIRGVVAKVDDSTPGTIRQGGGYYIYAQVTDNASLSTVTANASSFDTWLSRKGGSSDAVKTMG